MISKIKLFFQIWFGGFNSSKKFPKLPQKTRKPIISDTILINIHEWGGYLPKRIKKVKGIKEFECGLFYQLKRFSSDYHNKKVDITITLSDAHLYKDIDNLKKYNLRLMEVDNQGFDFSGYSRFYDEIKNLPNSYVILTNSSINKEIIPFLDSFIDYMDKNQDVGILGISGNSKFYHTVFRNNYNPHLQSFFLLTTIEVLKEIVTLNNNTFPGKSETNKHLLIRNGEVKISHLALQLGYHLALVTENKVFKFDFFNYPLKKGDARHFTNNPNTIFPISL